MVEILSQYFKWVFREDFFIIALDRTGCYFFTDYLDDAVIGQQFSEALNDLALTEKQAVLCVVGRNSQFNYCSLELVGKFVLQATQKRKAVLTDSEIFEILDAYGIEKQERKIEQRNWANTDLFKQLKDSEFGLSEMQINEICRIRPNSVQQLRKLDVPDRFAMDILKQIEVSEKEESSLAIQALSHQPSPEFREDLVQKMIGRQAVAGTVCFVIALMCMAVSLSFVFPVIFAVTALVFAVKVKNRADSTAADFAFFLCWVLVIGTAVYGAVEHKELLMNLATKVANSSFYDITKWFK